MLPLTCGRAAVRDRSQHDVACPDKEATGTHGNTNEFYLDGLDREELLSQCAPALTAQKCWTWRSKPLHMKKWTHKIRLSMRLVQCYSL